MSDVIFDRINRRQEVLQREIDAKNKPKPPTPGLSGPGVKPTPPAAPAKPPDNDLIEWLAACPWWRCFRCEKAVRHCTCHGGFVEARS